jgi:hypothetical protein
MLRTRASTLLPRASFARRGSKTISGTRIDFSYISHLSAMPRSPRKKPLSELKVPPASQPDYLPLAERAQADDVNRAVHVARQLKSDETTLVLTNRHKVFWPEEGYTKATCSTTTVTSPR